MDKRWDIEIAKEFKARNNPQPLGAMLGKVLSPLPDITIELLHGNAIIDSDKIYLSNAITNRLAIECTFKEFESANNTAKDWTSSSNTVSGLSTSGTGSTALGDKVLTLSGHSGNLKELKAPGPQNAKENKEKGKVVLQTIFNLVPGMFVLVIPNQEEDKFFVVDVFTYAKEVDLSWEYYQK